MGPTGAASVWMVLASALALLAIPGLALFYRGIARGVARRITLSLAGAAIVPILWLLYGHGLVFGVPLVPGLVGNPGQRIVLGDIPGADSLAVIAFVLVSAIVAVTILAVAVADLVSLPGWLVFTAVWLSVVLFPVMYWVLNETGGWASGMGVTDLAGGSFMHISAGASALALLLVLGEHRNRLPEPPSLGSIDPAPAQRRVWTTVGVCLVFVGWLGLNISSEGALDELTGLIALNTIAAAATGVIGWIVAEKLSTSRVSPTAPAAGALSGLVAIAPGCGSFAPGWASALGLLAGAVCAFGVLASRRRGRGSSFTVVNIHAVAGLVGMLYIGVFGAEVGFIYNGNPAQSIAQVSTVVGVGLYSFAASWVLGFAVHKSVGLGRSNTPSRLKRPLFSKF
jgi:ammonium transporter, Amt family